MVDSSSWTIPDSESGGCQLGILEEFFLEAKSKMATGDYVLHNIFGSKPPRNTILVSMSMLSGSLNQMMLNKSCLYDRFSRWPPYKNKKWRFRPVSPQIRHTSLCDVVLVNGFDMHLYIYIYI